MKLKYIIPAFVALFATMLVSCNDDEATYLDEIKVSQSTVAIDANGGTTTIEIDAADAWSFVADEIPEWLTIAPTSGQAGKSTISFSATAYDGRTAELHIMCAGKVQNINVIQGLAKVEDATCAQIIAGPDSKTYRVTGTCTGIYNTQYGNWYLTDDTGTITIYGTLDKNGKTKNFLSLGLEVGDIVTVEGPKTTYGTTIELVDVTVIKIVKSLIKVVEVVNAELPLEGGEAIVNLECKGDGVNVEIPEEAKSWLAISAVTSGATPYVKFHAAPNTGGDRNVEVTFKTYADGKEYTATTTISQKGAIIAASVAEFLAAPVGDTQYRLSGVVTNVEDAASGKIYIKDYSGEVYGYKVSGFAGKVGDIVTVVGKRGDYKGTAQIVNGVVEDMKVVNSISIADFLNLPDDANTYYIVTGVIDEIANDQYGNVYINDGNDNRLYVYGTYPGWGATGDARKGAIAAYGIEVGDELTVIGVKATYKGTPQLSNGVYFTHVK